MDWHVGMRNVMTASAAIIDRISPASLVAGATLLVSCADQGPSNIPPTAAFTVACADLSCQLTSTSTDADGTIKTYEWDFGDGARSSDRNPVHAYAAPGGQFTVRLTVTDDHGATTTAAKPVTAQHKNAEPVADFTISCTILTCRFSNRSTDPDGAGALPSSTWDFGDGQTSSEENPTHAYAEPGGRFTVTLTVKDTEGAVATAVRRIDLLRVGGTYERETPHRAIGLHSRYVIYDDGRFRVQNWVGADTTVFTGRWTSAEGWFGFTIKPGSVLILDFDGFGADICGEGYGAFLVDGHLGIALCGALLGAGLEEGVYTTAPIPATPGPPPPTAGQIAFVRDGRIYLANTDGGGLVPISSGPKDGNPVWSPDGKRIAFLRTSGTTTGIFVMDADGGNVVQRAALGSAPFNEPTWSPDGQWLAFACYGDGGAGICKVRADADGGAPVNVTPRGGQVYYPAWSRDGTRIAFTSDWVFYDFFFDIWVVEPNGARPSALTTHSASAPNAFESYQATWAPDGQTIAFVSCTWAFNFCSSSAISVMRADGSGIKHLVATSGFARPTWSPDGRVIAFGSGNAIDWVTADGSQRGRIIDNGRSPTWRP